MASITVVDDNRMASLFVASSLKGLGHEVTAVEPSCLFSVFQALHEHPPDLLITDLIMPSCPGLSILRFCREDPHLEKVKIILLTSGGDQELGKFLQNCGSIHYLRKPVSPQALEACVEQFLAGTLELNHGWELACRGVVAVVDDSRMTRAHHAAALRKLGFRPVEVAPQELVATRNALEAMAPDLILLDYLMPSFNGDALLRVIRSTESLRDTPVLMVTSHQNADLETRLGNFLKVGIAIKPVSLDDLQDRVQRMLEDGA